MNVIFCFFFILVSQMLNAQNTKEDLGVESLHNSSITYYADISSNIPSSDDINLLVKNKDENLYCDLLIKYHSADIFYEALLFCLVSANKLGINKANMGVAECLSESLTSSNLGKYSKNTVMYYLNKWKSSTDFIYADDLISSFLLIPPTDSIKYPHIDSNSSQMKKLKVGCLKGNICDYIALRDIMLSSEMYGSFLYYSYVMYDRYSYEPANRDMITIIKRFYNEYNLGEIDDDTKMLYDNLKK